MKSLRHIDREYGTQAESKCSFDKKRTIVTRIVVQGNLSSPPFALVTYRPVNNGFTHRQKQNNTMLRKQMFQMNNCFRLF